MSSTTTFWGVIATDRFRYSPEKFSHDLNVVLRITKAINLEKLDTVLYLKTIYNNGIEAQAAIFRFVDCNNPEVALNINIKGIRSIAFWTETPEYPSASGPIVIKTVLSVIYGFS